MQEPANHPAPAIPTAVTESSGAKALRIRYNGADTYVWRPRGDTLFQVIHRHHSEWQVRSVTEKTVRRNLARADTFEIVDWPDQVPTKHVTGV